MSDTPETDAACKLQNSYTAHRYLDRRVQRIEYVPSDHARRLERERDEARARLDATCSPESFSDLVRQRTELIAELDALREALRQILGWRELRSGANEIPIGRIEDIARAILGEKAK